MSLVQLTLAEIDLIATYVLRGDEQPFSGAFEAATTKFYGEDGFDPSDAASMSRVAIVDLPSGALASLPDRLYAVADDMDSRARLAGRSTDHASSERLHRGAGKLRAIAIHVGREAA